MTVTVKVEIPGTAYDVAIGEGLLREVGARLRAATEASSCALVTDGTVADRYGLAVDTSLARAGFRVVPLTIPAGETSKSWGVAGQVLEMMAAGNLDRTSVVVALGGGVVGDLAGFVAAVYQRGIEFAQVPTTLLAMVDSSVGGKTAVDLAAGKNLAGAFKQPIAVIADTSVLKSLPDDEWRSGLAEIAKSAVLDGDEFLAWMEASAEALVAREESVVVEAIERTVRFKAAVVSLDEKEEGPRESLNYGHTFGHAIEKVAGYGTFTHGAAVAEGMRFASRVAVQLAGATPEFVRRQDRLLDALGLSPLGVRLDISGLLDAMRGDKKSRAGAIRMVLPQEPGVWRCEAVPDAIVSEHLSAWASRAGEE